jgi:hypothetical protein
MNQGVIIYPFHLFFSKYIQAVLMKKIRKYFYFFGLFFLMFPPHLIIHGYTIKTVYFFVVIPGIIGGYKFLVKRKKSAVEKDTLLLMFIAFVYFCILSGLVLFKDTSVISQILLGVVILFACSFYVNNYNKIYGDQFIPQLFKDLNKACIINSLFVIATFLSPHFKEFLYSFIGISETSRRYLFGDVLVARYQGIVPSGFSFLSTTHALLLIIGIWGFFMDKKKYRITEIILFSIGQIIIFASILLIGRTGLILILFFLLGLIFYRINYIIQNYRASKKSFKLIFAFVVIALLGLMTVNFSKYKKNLNFAFELVITLTQKRSLDRSTAHILNHMLFFPHKPVELFFGTGNFGRNNSMPYINSDVGYVIFINGAGIIGMLVAYSFFLPGFYYSFKYWRLNPFLSWFITVYLFALMILNLKDYYYVSQVGYSQIYFIMICILGKKIDWKNINGNKNLIMNSINE